MPGGSNASPVTKVNSRAWPALAVRPGVTVNSTNRPAVHAHEKEKGGVFYSPPEKFLVEVNFYFLLYD
jgi:hypothetical protein